MQAKAKRVNSDDLENRIADAFGEEQPSTYLNALLKEVAAAEEDAGKAYQMAKEVALDPATRPAAVAQARTDMEDAEFRSTRMSNAAVRLTELLEEATQRERQQRWEQEYHAAKVERDQLVDDLRKEYPAIVEKLVALLERVEASDVRIANANSGAGERYLRKVEDIARETAQSFDIYVIGDFPKLTSGVRLPGFLKDDRAAGRAWPKPSRYG